MDSRAQIQTQSLTALPRDLCSDTLPEAITRAVAKMTATQRFVQLAKDHDLVKKTLIHDSAAQSHVGKGLHCAHVEDALGAQETTEVLMLIPIGDDIMTGFENSMAWKTGMLTNVPTSLTYVKVSKEVARVKSLSKEFQTKKML